MTSEEKMREEYEKFTGKSWHCHLDMTNRIIWESAWKASRESLVICLPYSANGYIDGCSLELELMDADDVRESIHAAGVKTK